MVDFKVVAKLIKQENGSIDLVNSDGNIFKSVPSVAVMEITQNQKLIEVRQAQDNSVFYIDPEKLEATQVLPNAEVPFDSSTSTIFDLLALLRADFFFDLVGSGSGAFYPSGEYVDFLPTYTAQGTISFNADQYYGMIVEVLSDIKIDESFARVAVASTGLGLIGIYKYNISLKSWTLAASVGNLDLSVAGSQFLSYGSEISLSAGIYATGFILQNATTMDRAQLIAQKLIFGRASLNTASQYKNLMAFSHVWDGTLPTNPAGVSVFASANNIPLTYHKIV